VSISLKVGLHVRLCAKHAQTKKASRIRDHIHTGFLVPLFLSKFEHSSSIVKSRSPVVESLNDAWLTTLPLSIFALSSSTVCGKLEAHISVLLPPHS
jgi:hypothetical protein